MSLKRRYTLFFIGLIIILLFVHLRFLHTRLPRSLVFNNQIKENIPIIIFLVSMVIISLTIIVISITSLCKIKLFSGNNILLNSFTKIYENIIYTLQVVFDTITSYFPYNFEIMRKPIIKFYSIFKKRIKLLVILFYSINIIILLCFVYDVFFLFKLQNFYKGLLLIGIQLLFRIWLYTLQNWSNSKYYCLNFIYVEKQEDNSLITQLRKDSNIPLCQDDLNYYTDVYLACTNVENFLKAYNNVDQYYRLRILLFVYSVYLYLCTYVIILNIS